MNDMVNAHALLGVSPEADVRTIKRAYRRLTKKCHPDLNPSDPQAEQRFKQIQRAYECITGRWNNCHGSGEEQRKTEQPTFFQPDNDHPFFGFYWAVREYWLKNKL